MDNLNISFAPDKSAEEKGRINVLKNESKVKNISISDKDISIGFLGSEDDEAELLKKLISNDIKLSSFARQSGNIEEIFMKATEKREVLGDEDADLLIVGWGGTYGHLYETMETMQENGKKVAFAHFKFINPLPKNTAEVLSKYKKVVVAEQNNGQFANYLRGKVPGFNPYRFNRVKGQPFVVARLAEEFTKILEA